MTRRSARLEEKQLEEKKKLPTESASKPKPNTRVAAVKGKAKKPKATVDSRTVIVGSNASNVQKFLRRLLKEAPVDIMLEIFSHLQPTELLNLARASKYLRAILLSKSSLHLWKAVIMNAGLPPKPDDICELKYASLANDSYCHVRSPVSSEVHVLTFGAYRFAVRVLAKLFPGNADYDAMMNVLAKCGSGYFIPSLLEGYRLEFVEVRDDPDKLGQWMKERQAKFIELTKHAERCREWHVRKQLQAKAEREAELDKIRGLRMDTILKKLAKLGYDEEDLACRPQITHHSLVNQAKKLTEKEWEKIKPRIIEVVEKALRLEAKKQSSIQSGSKSRTDANTPVVKGKAKKAKVDAHVAMSSENARFLQKLFTEAPLDILLEIFSHLQPKELLNLARTSKDLRAMLLSKRSLQIWRAVIKNAELPLAPGDISEPQYASLAYDSFCHYSSAGRVPVNLLPGNADYDVMTSVLDNSGDRTNKWPSDIQDMQRQGILELVPRVITGRQHYYIPSILEDYCLQFVEMKSDPEKLAKWKMKKQQNFTDLKKVEPTLPCSVHAKQCQKWHARKLVQWKAERKAELEEIRERRIDKHVLHASDLSRLANFWHRILKNLAELGWDEKDLERRPQIIHHSLVNQPKELTDEEWGKIKSRIIEVVERDQVQTQGQRLQALEYANRYQKLAEAYNTYWENHPKAIIPPIGDVVMASPNVESLIWDTPCDEMLSTTSLSQALETDLPNMRSTWIANTNQQLRTVLVRRRVQGWFTAETAAFQCRQCAEVLWIPRVYSHSCCFAPRNRPSTPRTWKKSFNPFKMLSWRSWSAESLRMPFNYEYARDMMQICSLDLKTTSLATLDEVDPLFECLDCRHGPRRLFLMWTSVLAHDHERRHRIALVRLGELEESVKSAAVDYFGSRYPLVGDEALWRCNLCENSGLYQDIKAHIRERHDLADEDIKREHWYADRDMHFAYLHPKPFKYDPSGP
ncbi:hypothetical protein VNI00_006144 [Paramarasmius palmivorus]|uniref:F-box domain-containing protein n=1 Tax=Paramarasmius palmivorus TaxID=297713 RepID=A0AAW0D505_9AGAR